MMTLQEIQEFLTHISYRPDWTFEAYQGTFEGIHLRILAVRVEDSYSPGTFIDLGITSPLPPMENVRQLQNWLAWRLGRIEEHEMREWLKYDGKPYYNPHHDGHEEQRDLEPIVP